jgi:hypothetical protein
MHSGAVMNTMYTGAGTSTMHSGAVMNTMYTGAIIMHTVVTTMHRVVSFQNPRFFIPSEQTVFQNKKKCRKYISLGPRSEGQI